MAQEKIRESIIAGSWYPGNASTLEKDLNRYLEQAHPPEIHGELKALIVPHAGYVYSGGVAAHAYRLLQDRPFDRVMILAPSHRAYFKGASVYTPGGYRTPLGIVPLDREIIDALLRHPEVIRYVPEADAQEHSLEIQLPFLQHVLKEFRLTPIIVGEQSLAFCRQLAAIICEACRGLKVLLVASSDLSHFHPSAQARNLDRVVCDNVAAFDPEALSRSVEQGECEACGAGPMLTVMLAARELEANAAQILRYADSGEISGDSRSVVGYLAAALTRSSSGDADMKDKSRSRVSVDLGLSTEEKSALRHMAVQAIRSRCLGQTLPELAPDSPRLMEKRGAFVCIHKGEELRGCIGMIEGKAPLLETVRSMAVQAAFADPRFCAVQIDELDALDIEISVLTPLERVEHFQHIEVGKHGLCIKKGYHSGLLLPQVATEHGWNREQFLEWTCRKAGLDAQAWQDPETEVYVFSADVF